MCKSTLHIICLIAFCMLSSLVRSSPVMTDISQVDSLPNILLILTDDQGYHDVSYYGTEDIRTPHMDSLSAQGMRFDKFYANCPVCSPTRAALLTGRYQDYVGVPGVIRTDPEDSWGYLDPSALLLPSALKEAGYHTTLIGKWHLGLESPNTPNERGFDKFKGWLGDMMDDYWQHRRHGINYMRDNDRVIDPEGHATDLFTAWSIDYIRQQAKDDQPFFLYLAYNAPHFPVQPLEEWLQRVKQREPHISDTRANLVAFIEHLDDGIGQVIQALKQTGQYDNTLIIFTSDNGGHLPSQANNGPLRDGKQSMYEGGLLVPTCMVWPGRISAGSVSDEMNLSMDIFPTLLEVAGLSPADNIEGRSFLPVLLGEPLPEENRAMYFTRREGGTRYGGQSIYAIRQGEWKLLQNNPYEPMELYNLREDPREQYNRIDEEPEKYEVLLHLLMKHIQAGGRVPWQPPVSTH